MADDSLRRATENAKLRAQHMRDLTPLMRSQALKWQRATERAFQQSRSPAGDQWPPLAPSTIASRIKTQDKRERGRRTGYKPLIKGGTLNITLRYIPESATIKVSAVPYLAPHVTGSYKRVIGRPPKRNPLVYERVGGKPALAPDFAKRFRDAFIKYVEDGRT